MKQGLLALMVILIFIFPAAISASPPPPANYQVSSPLPEMQNEEQVWVSPIDSNIVIALWRDFRLGYRQVAVGRSTDAGNTWTDSLVTVRRDTYQSDPCVDVDADGKFYLSFLDWGGNNYISLISSEDDGLSWGELTTINAPPGYIEDKQFMTVDRTGGDHHGKLYMAWMRYCADHTCTMCYFTRKQSDLFFFDTPIEIGPPPDLTDCGYPSWSFAGQFPQPLVGSDGDVYVFWNYYDTTDCSLLWTIHMVKSTDGGVTFTDPTKVKNVFGNLPDGPYNYVDGAIHVYNMPVSAADITGGLHDGNIYISYAAADTANTDYFDYNIEFIRSSDGGDTWTDPIYVNDDYTGPGAAFDQFHPWLYCNQDGMLICIFYDQRLDTLNHYKFDLFAAYSYDGGETFTANQRISSVSSSPDQAKSDLDYQAGPPWAIDPDLPWDFPPELLAGADSRAGKIAEYIGVTAFHDHVNAVWTDTRNGNQDVYGANWNLPVMEPRLLAPPDGSTVTTAYPHFDWATSWKTDDDRYLVEVATDNQFINTVLTEYSDSAGLVSATNALADGLYYWRVSTIRISDSYTSEYSDVWSLTVGDYVCVDSDGDGYGKPGIPDSDCPADNCPYTFNQDQSDVDGDLIGDVCDNCPDDNNAGQEDGDEDEIGDLCDNCPNDSNPGQNDVDADEIGDICDNCPETYNPEQTDSDGNEIGDACDYVCGDADGSRKINILDVTFIVSYLYKGGPAPDPLEAADADGSGGVNLLDITHIIRFLYKGGEAPIC